MGHHEGGYTEFTLDVTGALKPGVNHLAVQVDNRALITKWPPVLGYFNYGGIHRSVSLEIVSGPVLEALVLETTPLDDRLGYPGWELLVRGCVAQVEAPDALVVRVRSAGLSWEDALEEDGTLNVRVPFCDVPAWSPENPHLVSVVVELLDAARSVLDRREFTFGFRTLALRDGRICLNNRPYPLIGTFPFCFTDYRDPSKVPNGYWNELNLKGLVDYRRRKKLAFDAVKTFYQQSR